jgi:hypothetical protein
MANNLNTPFDKLLEKYNKSRKELEEVLANLKYKEQQNDPNLKEDEKRSLEQIIKSERTNITRYAGKVNSPSIKICSVLIDFIRCTPEELLSVIKVSKKINSYFKDYNGRKPVSVGRLSLPQSSLEDKNLDKPELAFTQQISTQVDNSFQEINKNTTDQISEEKRLVIEDFKFEIIRLHVVAVYSSDNCMDSSKCFEIKSLVDNLECVNSFDCYHCVRDERNVYLNGSKCVKVEKVYEPEGELNFLNLAFKESLGKGQKRIFNVNLSAQKVLEYDTKFHGTWVRQLTKQLKMSITPSNPFKGMEAKVWEYRNKSERSHKRGTHLADLCLDESLIFEWEMADPVLNHIYEIRWED